MAERPTEGRHPRAEGLHAVPGEEALARLLDAQAAALAAVRPAIPAIEAAARAAAQALGGEGRLAYAGAGSSGLMALADALELPGTFGIPPERTPILFAGGAGALLRMAGGVEDDTEAALREVAQAGLGPGDVLLAVAASGSTPYTVAAARAARERGATVAAIAHVAGSPLLAAADIPILLDTGPEMVAGSTRLGAGTAQKVALNLLSTRAGLLLGHVHDGYMVNLVADNAKLRDRAARIVMALAGCGREAAESALDATAGAVKPAVLVALGLDAAAAQRLTHENGGHLAPSLRAVNHPPRGGVTDR